MTFSGWLTIVLFVYVATAFSVHIPWGEVIASTFWPLLSAAAFNYFHLPPVGKLTLSDLCCFIKTDAHSLKWSKSLNTSDS